MADPVTNVEIEDVLSSIRRLVSDEARTPIRSDQDNAFHSGTPPQAVELQEENQISAVEDVAKSAPPALVLTAALRVETPEHESNANEVGEAETEAQQSEAEAPALILTQDDFTENTEEDAPEDDASAAHDESDSAESLLVEELVYEQPETIELESDPQVEGDPQNAPDEPQALEDAQDVASEEENEVVSDEESDEEPLSIEGKIAALEALISQSESDFEPDGVEDGANAAHGGDALPWEDSVESTGEKAGFELPNPDDSSQSASFDEEAIAFQRAHSEAVETAQDELEANATETLLESEDIGAVLDEEALRDMVAEIVRQELQGPLGERITRNVRKLVRREIYRALAANELD